MEFKLLHLLQTILKQVLSINLLNNIQNKLKPKLYLELEFQTDTILLKQICYKKDSAKEKKKRDMVNFLKVKVISE